MRAILAATVALASGGFTQDAQAQAQDWRSCIVTVCSNGQCDGPNSNLLVVAPANFADPGFGGEAAMMPQLEALAERLYPSADGWSRRTECARRSSEARAMEVAKANVELAKMPPASREIKIASPFDVWKYTEAATGIRTSNVASAPVNSNSVDREHSAPQPMPRPQSQEPMHFLLYMGLREPSNGVNANCFSNIITLPAPEGYRGQSPTLKNALPIIKSYFPAFEAACAQRGTPYGSVVFMTDDTSPTQAMINMKTTIDQWRGYRFPEVYVAK